jgi:hypothetical protein
MRKEELLQHVIDAPMFHITVENGETISVNEHTIRKLQMEVKHGLTPVEFTDDLGNYHIIRPDGMIDTEPHNINLANSFAMRLF